MINSDFLNLIGEENGRKFSNELTDIVLDQIRSDLENNMNYIIESDEIVEFVDSVKDKVLKEIEEDLSEKFRKEFRTKLGLE